MSDLTNERNVSPLRRVLRLHNFRLLWMGEGISLLGDQFYMIALPWLVLKMTGDALAVGGVLAVAAIPRALFMLIGGALTDRFSPRTVMLGSNLFRMIIVALLTALVIAGSIHLWMLYVLTLIFGVVDAFFFPAQSSVIPQIVDKENLQIGNSIIQGTAQLSRFAGPILAGSLIALLAGRSAAPVTGAEYTPDLLGIGYALGFDALTFFVSVMTLWRMRIVKSSGALRNKPQKESVWSAIRVGLFSVWNDVELRTFFLVTMAINVLVNGPILVGIPVLADTRFPEGAAAFGILMSAYGGGNLMGTILAGVLPRPTTKPMGSRLLVIISVLGIGVALLGLTSSISFAVVIGLSMGMANGYVTIVFITWLQSRTPLSMLGRLMSLLMFAAIGLNPISMSLSGFFMQLDPTATFVGAGVLMTAIVLLAALNPEVRKMKMRVSEAR
jgi:MFS family permease